MSTIKRSTFHLIPSSNKISRNLKKKNTQGLKDFKLVQSISGEPCPLDYSNANSFFDFVFDLLDHISMIAQQQFTKFDYLPIIIEIWVESDRTMTSGGKVYKHG